jgi:hypothetical protein
VFDKDRFIKAGQYWRLTNIAGGLAAIQLGMIGD